MTVRSLSEAAADVLARSQSSADKEPMHTLGGAEVQDLGGSTIEKPEGNDVGRQAAAKISQAAKPGPAPKLGAMPMPKVAGAVAEEAQEDEEDYIDEDEEDVIEEQEEMTLDEKRAMIRAKMQEMSCKEDVDAMFSGQDLSEEFIDGLRGLFVEHNINIPDEQVEVVEAMAEEMAELQEELNKALNLNVELVAAINEATKESIISSVCEGLTATQAEKVKALAEGVEFTTEGEYQEKVALIKESYFDNKVKQPNVQSSVAVKEVLAEQTSDYSESTTSPLMERYVSAISRTLNK